MSKIKIAFTSCTRYKAFKKQPEWDIINKENPHYLFLLGDNIYMDYGWRFFSSDYNGKPRKYSSKEFETIMNQNYKDQWEEKHFKSLFTKMKENNAVFGIWDDHDFAWNDCCGVSNDDKKLDKKYLVPEEKKNISRRLFNKYMYGKENCDDDIYKYIDIPNARVIFLDNRFYAQKPSENDEYRTLLGEKQKNFLENALAHDLKYTFICSGLSLTKGHEKFSKYTEEYGWFSNLIKEKGKNVVSLSGDIHENGFFKPNKKDRPCYEVISSGMAMNYLGLPYNFNVQHNFAILEYDENSIEIQFYNKKGKANKESIVF